MKMRTKTLIAIAALTITIFVILYFVANFVVLRSFAVLEEQETRKSVMRTTNALLNEYSDLNGKVADWAFWDDTYVFVQNVNEDYVNLNLGDSAFINLRLNLILCVNSVGQIVYAKAFDLNNVTEVPVYPSIMSEVASHGLLWNHSSTVSETLGTLILPETPMLIASKPILTSQEEGPIMGALIFGRCVDSREIGFLSQAVGLQISVSSRISHEIPADFQLAYSKLSGNSSVYVQALGDNVVGGYSLVRDVYEKPAFLFRVDNAREVYQQGVVTVNYFMILSLVVCLIFGGTMMVLLEFGVVSPLSRLTTSVKKIGRSFGDLTLVSRLRTDEMSILSQAIKDAMSQRLAAIEELAGMIGHDLRNPLTGISTATYYLKAKYASAMDDRGKEMLKIIEDDVAYSNKIVNDLLEYSRRVHLELQDSNPKSLVEKSLALLSVPENVQLVNLTQEEPEMRVDLIKMSRAFTNLIKNAFDAMPSGGSLTIESRKLNEHVEFTFADTGVGMTKETLEKIWTPLYTTKAKGMGFGLPITKRFIEAHGGRISVTSILNKGTTFRITVPLDIKAENETEVWTKPEQVMTPTEHFNKPLPV
jgi:signal transduction histidine kinase